VSKRETAEGRVGPPDVVVERCPPQLADGTRLRPSFVFTLVTKAGSDWFDTLRHPDVSGDSRRSIVLEAPGLAAIKAARKAGLIVEEREDET
jgi:hypothetical protein